MTSRFAVLVLAILLSLTGAVVLRRRPQWTPAVAYACVGLIFVDVGLVHIGGSMLRPYQLLVLALLGGVTANSAVLRSRLVLALAAWTLLVVGSLLWSVYPSDTRTVAVGQVFLLVACLVFANLFVARSITVERALVAFRLGATASSAVAIVQFALSYLGFRWQIFDVHGIPWHRPAGLMTEPDWCGLVAALGAIVAYLAPPTSALRRTCLWICTAVVLLTAVRAVALSLAVLCLASLFDRAALGRLARRLVMVGAAAAVVLLIVQVVRPGSITRLNPIATIQLRGDQGSANSRLGVTRLVVEQGKEAPVIGHGAGTLASTTELQTNANRYVGGGSLNGGRGSTNLLLTNFWDLGVLGLVVTITVVGLWLTLAFRVRKWLPSLFPVSLLLVVDFQFNNGIRFGFVWVLFAFVAAAALTERRGAHDRVGTGVVRRD